MFEKGANFSELVFIGGFHRKRMKSELCGGTGEESLAEVFQNLALHQVLAEGGAVYVSAIGFVADDKALGSHDLQELEDRGESHAPWRAASPRGSGGARVRLQWDVVWWCRVP